MGRAVVQITASDLEMLISNARRSLNPVSVVGLTADNIASRILVTVESVDLEQVAPGEEPPLVTSDVCDFDGQFMLGDGL